MTSWKCSGSVLSERSSATGSTYFTRLSGLGKGNGSCIVAVECEGAVGTDVEE